MFRRRNEQDPDSTRYRTQSSANDIVVDLCTGYFEDFKGHEAFRGIDEMLGMLWRLPTEQKATHAPRNFLREVYIRDGRLNIPSEKPLAGRGGMTVPAGTDLEGKHSMTNLQAAMGAVDKIFSRAVAFMATPSQHPEEKRKLIADLVSCWASFYHAEQAARKEGWTPDDHFRDCSADISASFKEAIGRVLDNKPFVAPPEKKSWFRSAVNARKASAQQTR